MAAMEDLALLSPWPLDHGEGAREVAQTAQYIGKASHR